MLITITDANKRYGDKILCKDGNLSVEENDKIGLIGVNGAGKSTFLKVLSGADTFDSGTIIKKNGLRINYLPQMPQFAPQTKILEAVVEKLQPEDESKQFEAKSILTKLGLTEFERLANDLSGGQKKRVALACALVTPCDILMLDEPTNHLDNTMIEWLEKYLAKYKGAIVMVTHDRYFLERVCNRMIEIDNGYLFSYAANYSTYLELKEKRMQQASAEAQKRKQILKHELEWIRAGVMARGTKSKERIQRYERLKAIEGPKDVQNVQLESVGTYLGKKTIEFVNVTKTMKGQTLIKDFSYMVTRDDRLGLIGANGAGKTTLMRLITGEIQPDSGEIIIGESVRIGYFSQEAKEIDQSQRVIDYIRSISDMIETVDGTLSAAQMLERFLFPKDMHYMPISHLSGGERRRLYLLSVLMAAPNILLFDEPTNDLDIATLEILEDYLEGFKGAVIVVSHDRYFLDRVVDHIFVYEGNGVLTQQLGGYSYYMETLANVTQSEISKTTRQMSSERSNLPRMSSKEKQELATSEKVMQEMEQKIKELDEKMNALSDFQQIQELSTLRHEYEERLATAEMRWLELSELAEACAQARN